MMFLLGALAFVAGMVAMDVFEEDDDAPVEEAPEIEDPLPPVDQDDPVDQADTGASFQQTANGVEIELGEDETRRLAAIYYTDTEEGTGRVDLQVDEARFYLVPDSVDWSDQNWETRLDVPGQPAPGTSTGAFELEDFEVSNGLELVGTVDLLGVPEQDDPAARVGTITANAPIEGYLLEADTDGDELIRFLPEDFVVTRFGVPESQVSEDTTGTDGPDWFSTNEDGLTLNGGDGSDRLESENDNTTLLGGAENDVLIASGNNIIAAGGEGNDNIRLTNGTAIGGPGDDSIDILTGEADGGEGNDRITSFGDGIATLRGGEGDDSFTVFGSGSEAYGGPGDDFMSVEAGALGYGEEGHDRFQVRSGGHGLGGEGDDRFEVWNQFRDPDGAAIVTTGDGADTINALVWNPFDGAADDVYLRVTDFNPSEDQLEIGSFLSGDVFVEAYDIAEDSGGAFTDIIVTYTSLSSGLAPGIATIRLEGTTGVTADNITVLS